MSNMVGTYRLLRLLGRGARSRVHRARAATGEEVALRVLEPGVEAAARARFAVRARRVLEAGVPNVVAGLEAGGVEERSPWLATRLVVGRTLGQLLARDPQPERAVVLAVLGRVAVALDDLHARGLAHGDVKPASILLSLEDGKLEVVLADAGDVDDPQAIAADVEAFGRVVVRCLARELSAADRRAIGTGRDPDSRRPARSARALVDASRRATAPLPGPASTVAAFWDGPERAPAGPRAGRGRRRGVARLLVPFVLLVGLLAVWVAGSRGADGEQPGPGGTEDGPAPARSELLASVPPTLRDTCESADGGRRTSEELRCRDGAIDVRYARFADDAGLRAAYRRGIPAGLTGPTSASGPPACATGVTEERAWTTTSGDRRGRYRCELDSRGASITWTTESATGGGVLARAGRSDEDFAALFRWWREGAGPNVPG